MNPALVAALAAGATVVTPNKRLARRLVETHDRARVASGERAWPAARVLPWTAWVAVLEDDAVARGRLPPRTRVSEAAAVQIWRAAIEADDPAPADAGGLARLAVEAWQHVHDYGGGGPSWRAWAGGAGEPAAFARWAERFATTLERLGATDLAGVADRVAAVADIASGETVVLVGFLGPTPQQRRLVDALRTAGATVDEIQALATSATGFARSVFASPDDEWRAALGWARARIERDPDARVAIVVPQLAQRLDAVRACAIDVLGLPDDGPPAWNLSLGRPLAQVPRIATALDLAILATSALPVGRAAALLRSDALPGAATLRTMRAGVERRWLDRGYTDVRLADASAALAGRDDALARRLGAMAGVATRRTRANRHEWVDRWREAWRAAGWPGDRPSSSVDWQAERALDDALAAFAALDAVAARDGATLSADAALGELASHLASTTFQPELGDAPIQVLGLYEALGLPFDALWIAGMDDATLPPAPRLHPLLPATWQRERGVPRADAVVELARAQAIAEALARAAPEGVVSHAAHVDDEARAPSAMFDRGPTAIALTPPATQARARFDARPPRERRDDAIAPALAGERIAVRGGAGLLQSQSDCPFQALAAHRWSTDRWPAVAAGWTAMERGILAHAAFAAFWRAVGDQASLFALRADAGEYRAALARAADTALRTIDAGRRGRLPPIVLALEVERLVTLVHDWVETVDARRPDFAIAAVEENGHSTVGALEVGVRYDRVDRLADGGLAVLDYKTGVVPSTKHWRGPRPRAVQIALYAHALRDSWPGEAIRAAVMAQAKRGETKAAGLYADAAARLVPPGAREPVSVDWPGLEAEWGAMLLALADGYARGAAAVDPREPALCRTCARQALCRIDADDDTPDGDGDDDA